jgi:hypothetical protein
MKSLLAALLVAVCVTFGTKAVMACGGMATVDPPTLQLEDGPSTPDVQSVAGDLGQLTVAL